MTRTALPADLTLGIDKLDEQHAGYFHLIEKVEAAAMSQEPCQVVQETLDALVDYIDEHFATEKAMMVETDYPELKSHQQEHAYFVRTIMEISEDFRDGDCPVKNGMLAFMKDWFTNHILTTDTRLVAYLENR